MNKRLATHKNLQKEELRKATLCFLIKDNQILLAMKKRGFGEGRWNGVGGKPKTGETIEQAAIREAQEEIGINLESFNQVAVLRFYFPAEPDKIGWNQQVHVYIADRWSGEPQETEEMAPKWFDISQIPYEQMWEDDKHWLPKVLTGKKVSGDFLFDQDQKLAEFEIKAD